MFVALTQKKIKNMLNQYLEKKLNKIIPLSLTLWQKAVSLLRESHKSVSSDPSNP